MKKRILLPIIIAGGLVLSSCSEDLPTNYSASDQTIDADWTDYNIPPKGINFANGEDRLFIERGETHAYEYSIYPKATTNCVLLWESSDENVATVEDGVLTAVNIGTSTITVSEASDAFDPVKLTVNVTVAIESFDIESPAGLELDWNHTYTLNPVFTPSDTTFRELTWSIPEAEQKFATVSNGEITTYEETGTFHLTVTSGQLSGFSKELEFHVADRKIHVQYVDLVLKQGESASIEVDHYSAVEATVNPGNADDRALVKYYSRNPDIATVDMDTGVITAVKAGITKVFASCEGKESNEVTISVYEVFAREVHIDKTHDIEVTNDENGDAQLSLSYVTFPTGHSSPSRTTPTFTSSDKDIVTVSDDGVIHAVSTGNATITVTIENDLENPAVDTVNVTSKVYGTAITINGEHKGYYGEGEDPVVLTATVTPETSIDDVVSWSADPATRVDMVVNGNTISLTPTEEGPVTITATSEHNKVSTTHVVSFNERKIDFEPNNFYIVGNKQFKTGTSISGNASWTEAKYAYKLTFDTDNPDSSFEQYKGRIYFAKDDEWKVREGPEVSGWKDLYYEKDGQRVWNYEQAGAIDSVHMRADSSKADGNISVLKEGSYDIYYKRYISGDLAGEYRIYIGFTPTIRFDKESLTMGVGATTKIYLHNYAETVASCVSSDESVTVSDGTQTPNGMEYTLTAVSVGSAVITATDGAGKIAKCEVTVKSGATGVSSPIYLNAYDIFDADEAVPFVHAYNSTTTEHSDIKMSKVDGQDIIYTADIDEHYDSVIFARMPKGTTEFSWDKVYNQTKDSDAVYGDNNMFTISGYDDSEGKANVVGSWGIYDETIHYKVPAEYYLVGTPTSWNVGVEEYAFTKIDNYHYQLVGVALAVDDLVKVVSKNGVYYSNKGDWPGCHFTLEDDTYGGFNLKIDYADTYTIDLYLDNKEGNYVTFTGQGESPVEPPVSLGGYYIKAKSSGWAEDESMKMIADSTNESHFFLKDVSLNANEEIKINNPSIEGADGWFGVDHEYDNCHWTVGSDNNCVVNETGVYTVHLWLNSSDKNYIQLEPQSGGNTPVDPPVSTKVKIDLNIAVLRNKFGDAGDSLSGFSLYAWDSNNQALLGTFGEGGSSAGNLNSGYIEIDLEIALKIKGLILYFWQVSTLKQSNDIAATFTAAGEFDLYLPEKLNWDGNVFSTVTIVSVK